MIHKASRTAAVLLSTMLIMAPTLASAATVKVPEGAEMLIKFNDKLSSASNSQGD